MRLPFSLSLAAAGISFLLPSDGLEASLFSHALHSYFFHKEEAPSAPDDGELAHDNQDAFDYDDYPSHQDC